MIDQEISYQMVRQLFERNKGFIVLGLCGKTGSGVSTVAGILEKNFTDLHLPLPAVEEDLYSEYEYKLLYTFCEKNWKNFKRIKTRALITRHIMDTEYGNGIDAFYRFLREIGVKIEESVCKKYVDEFCTAEMVFDLENFKKYVEVVPTDQLILYRTLQKDEQLNDILETPVEELKEIERGTDFELEIEKKIISFRKGTKNSMFFFKNTELSKMLDIYYSMRKEKRGFKNEYYYWLMEQYIYDFLPKMSEVFWKNIENACKNSRVQALQCMGNNLRAFRKPYSYGTTGMEEIQTDAYNCIAEEINLAIKVLRAAQHKRKELSIENGNSESELVVVDSIKNPYESLYLKKRYRNYYLMGIYTEDEERHKRLSKENPDITEHMLKMIDTVEQVDLLKGKLAEFFNSDSQVEDFPQRLLKYMSGWIKTKERLMLLPFISQNIENCLESADIFINNKNDNASRISLKKNLIRYVSLAMNPGIVLPTPVERCMQMAHTSKINSGCVSRQVGAVITDSKYHFLSVGWNQQPEGQIPCAYRDICELCYHWTPDAYSDYENDNDDNFQGTIQKVVQKYFSSSDTHLSECGRRAVFCFKDIYNEITETKNQVHSRSLHAEETAFLNLSRNGIQLQSGGILFTTSSPCSSCAKKAMYFEIGKIYYAQPYRDISYKHVLQAGEKKKRPEFILFTGALGGAYTQLYSPMLPRKDEVELWCGESIKKMCHEIRTNDAKAKEEMNGEVEDGIYG